MKKFDNLKFDLSGLKKIIVPVYGIKIPVTIGNFIVSGDRRILNHILKTGLGIKEKFRLRAGRTGCLRGDYD